jgi:hypothetical protein
MARSSIEPFRTIETCGRFITTSGKALWYANVFPNRVILYKDPTTYRFTREVISA